MMTHPSGDWSVFQQIFADHWDAFAHAHPRYQTPYYEGLVAKMLACGNPEQMGYVEYRCLRCGQGTHRVAMSCKSALCLRCAKVPVDNWVSQVSQALHAGVIYRHIILTVPAMFIQAWAATGDDAPGMMEGTAAVPHPSAAAHLPAAAAVCDAATALDTTLAIVAPPPTLVELPVRHVLLPRALLPPIEINAIERSA